MAAAIDIPAESNRVQGIKIRCFDHNTVPYHRVVRQSFFSHQFRSQVWLHSIAMSSRGRPCAVTCAIVVVACLFLCFLLIRDTSLGHLWLLTKEYVVLNGAAGVFPALTCSMSKATATTTTAVSFDPNTFAGHYSDPNHPNCKRIIQVAGHLAAVSGTDGNPGCPVDGSGVVWTLKGQIRQACHVILVDFSPKGGPYNLRGVYNATEPALIQWQDGNVWTKIQQT